MTDGHRPDGRQLVDQRSLFDRCRPDLVAVAARRLPEGPGRGALAVLSMPEVIQNGNERNTVVAQRTVWERAGAPMWWTTEDSDTGLVAASYGVSSVTDGVTWTVMDDRRRHQPCEMVAWAEWPLWPVRRVVAVVLGERSSALGLSLFKADGEDVWSVLSAFDHAVNAAGNGPAVVSVR